MILFRGKKTDMFHDENWLISSAIQSRQCGVLLGELDKDTPDTGKYGLACLSENTHWYPIKPDTLCQALTYCTFDVNDDTEKRPIFDKDIVEIDAHGKKRRYAIWFMSEGSCFKAIPWDKEDVDNNDAMFVNYPINFKYDINWNDFILMVQDPYGDITSVKVIGNYIDNPEIFEPDDSKAIKPIVDIGTKKEQSNKVVLEF